MVYNMYLSAPWHLSIYISYDIPMTKYSIVNSTIPVYMVYFNDLMKDLKYEHQSIFSLLGRVKFNFRDR